MNIKQLLRKIVLKIRGEIGAVDADLQSAKRDISGLQSGKADKSDVSEVDIDLEGTGTIVSIPENATGYGTIEKLGGKSIVNYAHSDMSNHVYNDLPNGNYFVGFTCSSSVGCTITGVIDRTIEAGSYTYNVVKNGDMTIWFSDNSVISNFRVYSGTTDLGNYPSGMNSIYPTNVKSVGRNLWDEQWELGAINTNGQLVDSTTQIRSKNYIEVLPNSSYYFCNIDNTYTIYAFEYDKNYNFIRNLNGLNTIVTTSSTCAYLKFYVNEHNTYNYNICINKSNEAINGKYYPYTEHNLPQTNVINYVSTQLQTNHSWTQENASKWLGLGVGNDSNIIDYANKKAIVKYSIVDLGTLSWAGNGTFRAPLNDVKNCSNSEKFNAICSKYSIASAIGVFNGSATESISFEDNVYLFVRTDDVTPTGLLIYELETPIEIDLSSLETEEHFECESNGSIIHDNLANYKYSFPVSLKGQVELNFEHDKEQQRDIDSLKKEIDLKANDSDLSNVAKGLDKSLYNLGAFDTISGNVITRQTGYVDLGSLDWGVASLNAYNGQCTQMHIKLLNNSADETSFVSNILIPDTNWTPTLYHAKISSNQIFFNIPLQTSIDNAIAYTLNLGIQVQYKLATSYTEEIIEGQPLITLDSQGSQWLRNEWEKGLNLLNCSKIERVNPTGDISFSLNSNGELVVNGTSGSNYGYYTVQRFTFNGTYTMNGSINQDLVLFVETTGYPQDKTFTLNGTYDVRIQVAPNKTYNNVVMRPMLVEGDHAYPYTPYNSKAHITNYEADFLKEESLKSANLWDEQWESGSLGNNGEKVDQIAMIRSVNFINVKPDTTYTINTDSVVWGYDSGKGSISELLFTNGYTFTTPSNCYYIRFRLSSDYGTTYNNDIMINEGGHALPYQPYEGKILHEADGNGTLLWQNGSPNSAFDNQTITTADMNKFKYIVVGFKQNSGTDRATQYIKIKNELDKYAFFVSMGDGTSTENKYLRGFRLSSSTTVEFLYGFTNNNRDSNVCIPVEIYGTNVL